MGAQSFTGLRRDKCVFVNVGERLCAHECKRGVAFEFLCSKDERAPAILRKRLIYRRTIVLSDAGESYIDIRKIEALKPGDVFILEQARGK